MADLAEEGIGELGADEAARAGTADGGGAIPAGTEELRRGIDEAVVARDVALQIESAEGACAPEQIRLVEPGALELHTVVEAYLHIELRAPLVAGDDDDVPVAVGLWHAEDIDTRECSERAQQALGLGEQEGIVAVAGRDQQLALNGALDGGDVQRVGGVVGPLEPVVERWIVGIEDGLGVDVDELDPTLRTGIVLGAQGPREERDGREDAGGGSADASASPGAGTA